MAESSSAPPLSTFVVRFWRENSAAGAQWRGRVEHVQSGAGLAFTDLDDLLGFLRGFGIMTGGRDQGEGEKTMER
ncbi:MAG: hypothetical protein ACP5HM_09935 [Anaerolineae bacterium]